jgi:hypothetical protein
MLDLKEGRFDEFGKEVVLSFFAMSASRSTTHKNITIQTDHGDYVTQFPLSSCRPEFGQGET